MVQGSSHRRGQRKRDKAGCRSAETSSDQHQHHADVGTGRNEPSEDEAAWVGTLPRSQPVARVGHSTPSNGSGDVGASASDSG